jgi:hypothetical protein
VMDRNLVRTNLNLKRHHVVSTVVFDVV